MHTHAQVDMDLKRSLDPNMEITDLLTYIRELDQTNTKDTETKQKLMDICVERIYSQLGESNNECMDELKALLVDKRIQKSVVKFITSKPPAVITDEINSQLSAANEDSVSNIITETLTSEDELMQNILTKLDKIMRLIAVIEQQNSIKSSEKAPTAPPIVPARPVRTLQKAFNDHPLNRWRRTTGTNTDSESGSDCEHHEYTDIDYVTKYEKWNHSRIPTCYRYQGHEQTTHEVSVLYKQPCDVEYKSDESEELHKACDYDEVYQNECNMFNSPPSPRHYLGPQSASPPLTRLTDRCRSPVVFKLPDSSKPPMVSRPPVLSRESDLFKLPILSRPILQCRPRHEFRSQGQDRPLDRSEHTPEYSSLPRHTRLLQSKQMPQCRPDSLCIPVKQSMQKLQKMPIPQLNHLPQTIPPSQSKPLNRRELFYATHSLGNKSHLLENKGCCYMQNTIFSGYKLEPKRKMKRTYGDKMPMYETYLRNNEQHFALYNNNICLSGGAPLANSSGESQGHSDRATFTTDEEAMNEEIIAVIQRGILKTNECQNKEQRRVAFLEYLKQIFEY